MALTVAVQIVLLRSPPGREDSPIPIRSGCRPGPDSCSSRSGMRGRRPPRPTPRWVLTRATGCCVLRCRGPTMRTAEGTAGDDPQAAATARPGISDHRSAEPPSPAAEGKPPTRC